VIYEDAPHELGRDSEEMRASLPICLLANKLQVSLMYESSGLESVVLPLTSHVTPGKPLQFVVDQRDQLRRCLLVAVRKLTEQDRNIGLVSIHAGLSVTFSVSHVADILPPFVLVSHAESADSHDPWLPAV
jgi:hypothetical protein